jgi:hypothetical protein
MRKHLADPRKTFVLYETVGLVKTTLEPRMTALFQGFFNEHLLSEVIPQPNVHNIEDGELQHGLCIHCSERPCAKRLHP